MALTTLLTASQVQKYDSEYFAEYVRLSGFKPYMSEGANSVIVAKYELTSGGKTINIPLVHRLTGSGVTGTALLEGNEEALDNYNHSISIEWKRNGVAITADQEHYAEFSIRKAGEEMLKYWSRDLLRDEIITALNSKSGVAYGSASEAVKDLWTDANIDRVLFGNARGNVSTSAPAGGATHDHSASLATITTAMKLTTKEVSLMKRMAKTADPHIRPMRVNDSQGREYYVLFCGSLNFRDLKEDAVMIAANRDARPRDVDSNPIFQDGDLIYDGVIIREIPEIQPLTGVGHTSADVGPCFMCGAQALGVAWGKRPRIKTELRDYGHVHGVAIAEAHGVSKLVYDGVDHGMVTGYFAATADA